ncbi:rhodanese-like domain-containing protein [Kiloniella sp. EL199]|uniref:rhodanese-like domain-containing protein n=1 Tax=Kiloniella sp. EL199 TaxID=2107581 RepID=UPI000EA29495|nr:rhodanese-like domain-containing protein [Kiloniella sp. EL199]
MKSFFRVLTVIFPMFLIANVQADEISPLEVSGAKTVDVTEAKALFDEGVYFVDVRKDSDWEAGRVPDAIHIELKKIYSEQTLSEEVEKDAKVVIYCNGEKCLRSAKAVTQAVEWGFANVFYFRDGFPAWKTAGYPVE